MEEKLNPQNAEIATITINPETNEPVFKLFEKTEIETCLKDIK